MLLIPRTLNSVMNVANVFTWTNAGYLNRVYTGRFVGIFKYHYMSCSRSRYSSKVDANLRQDIQKCHNSVSNARYKRKLSTTPFYAQLLPTPDPFRSRKQHLRLRRKSKTRRALRLIENSVNGLQENVTKDREFNSVVGLNTTVARAATGRSKVDVATRNGKSLAANGDVEVRQSSAAREHVAALGVAVRGTGDFGVVGFDGGVGDEQESGAGVGDGAADAAGGGGGGANAVAAGGELPEAVGAVDGSVGDGTLVLGAVDEAEVVCAGGTLLQVDGEELLAETGLDGVEEGGLLGRPDGVDGAESEAEEAVVVGV